MISITGSDYQTHEIRGISIGFKEALRIWQRECPNDRLFCARHGVMESIALYNPDSIAFTTDRIERSRDECAVMEESDKARVARDMEAGRTQRKCGRFHSD